MGVGGGFIHANLSLSPNIQFNSHQILSADNKLFNFLLISASFIFLWLIRQDLFGIIKLNISINGSV